MPGWFKIRNAASEKDPVQILIYDQIGRDWFDQSGVNAAEFARELQAIAPEQEIEVRINSPGGNVFDGLAIYHQLRARQNKVTVKVDGVAASIASVIALAGRELQMPANAMLMIHDPSGLVMGDAETMRDMADRLDLHADNLAEIYAHKAGGTRQQWRELMRAETWYRGTEAVTVKLADRLLEEVKMAAQFDFTRYRRVPEALQRTHQTTAAQNGGAQTKGSMNREKAIALLNQHGVKVEATANDEVILAKLGEILADGKITAAQYREALGKPEPAAATASRQAAAAADAGGTGGAGGAKIVSLAEFQALQSQFESERTKRVTAEFNRIVVDNPNIDPKIWQPRVLADESLLPVLAAMPGRTVDPLRPSITNLGNPLVEKYRAMKPGMERQNFRLANEAECLRNAAAISGDIFRRLERIYEPRDANTLAAALVTDYLSDGLIIIANNKLAPLGLFSRDFGTDPMKPRATVQVPKATAGATTQTNATNFESGDTTLTNVPVTVNQLTQPFHLTNDQLNKGFQLAQLSAINADVFSNAISDVWTALDVAGNFGTAQVIGASTAFAPDDLPAIFGTAKNYRMRNLLLDGSYLAYLFPGVIASFSAGTGIQQNAPNTVFPGVFGFDALAMQNRWTGATANSVGFVCGPDAIALASGLPIGQPAGEFISMQEVTLDGAGTNTTSLGLTVRISVWYSRSSRTIWASFDVMFGAAAGDTTQGKGLVSA